MKKVKKLIVLALAVGMLATSVLGTSAAFDPVYYAKQNPDVVKVLGDSPEMLKLHYDLFGRKEARMSNTNDVEAQLRRLFKADEYAKLFPDVKKAFGDNKEAMFQHYIAFGLLEGRRPSEKVSQAAANSLKKSVEKAMTDAKIEVKPGSVELVKVITGEIQTTVTTKNGAQKAEAFALETALTQVAEVVTKAVTETMQEVNKPASASTPDSAPSSKNEIPIGPVEYTVAAGTYRFGWPGLHDADENNSNLQQGINGALGKLNFITNDLIAVSDEDSDKIKTVSFKQLTNAQVAENIKIPKHKHKYMKERSEDTAIEEIQKEGYWIGVGIIVADFIESYIDGYGGYLDATTEADAKAKLKEKNWNRDDSGCISQGVEVGFTKYAAFYWDLDFDGTAKKYGYLLVRDTKKREIYKYLVDLTTNVEKDTTDYSAITATTPEDSNN